MKNRIFKKLITAFILCTVFCSASFARVVIKQSIDGIGPAIYFDYNCLKPEDKLSLNGEFIPVSGVFCDVNWEFDTDNLESPVHFYVGAGAGLELSGVPFAFNLGCNIKLAEFKKTALELDTELKVGQMNELFGSVYLYVQESACVTLCRTNRRGLFGGAGLTICGTPWLGIYKGEGVSCSFDSFIGGKIFIGVRI